MLISLPDRMSPNEWIRMGGEYCIDCSQCRRSEWALAAYLGREETNAAFQNRQYYLALYNFPFSHLATDWQTWLTQQDVDEIVAAGLNTVRIPMGFWIIEDIVDKTHEPYAEGGLDELVVNLVLVIAMFKVYV
jgi:hypothetical protein